MSAPEKTGRALLTGGLLFERKESGRSRVRLSGQAYGVDGALRYDFCSLQVVRRRRVAPILSSSCSNLFLRDDGRGYRAQQSQRQYFVA